jgi:hypothetical protein
LAIRMVLPSGNQVESRALTNQSGCPAKQDDNRQIRKQNNPTKE